MAKRQPKSREKPWLHGIVDTLVGARLLATSQIPHRNRLAVIMLDSAFETACRAYLKYVANIRLEEAHKRREALVKTVKAKLVEVDSEVWDSIDFYYEEIRNDLYHQTSSQTITNEALLDYQETVEFVIDSAFGVASAQLADAALASLQPEEPVPSSQIGGPHPALVTGIPDKADKLVLAVGQLSPKTYLEVNEFFSQQGDRTKVSSDEFTSILGRNSGSKRHFYYNRESKRWQLSALGRFKLTQLEEASTNGR
jgi:hypothetical protein